MNKDQKREIIDSLTAKFNESNAFYLTDASGMTVEAVNNLRRVCHKKGIQLKVAKNSLIEKAFDASSTDLEGLKRILKGPTAIMFTETANLPAKLIIEFRGRDKVKPVLKGAFIYSSFFYGDNSLEELSNLKSKDELVGDIIMLLQSPLNNVMSALNSGGNTLAGLVKTLEERA